MLVICLLFSVCTYSSRQIGKDDQFYIISYNNIASNVDDRVFLVRAIFNYVVLINFSDIKISKKNIYTELQFSITRKSSRNVAYFNLNLDYVDKSKVLVYNSLISDPVTGSYATTKLCQ